MATLQVGKDGKAPKDAKVGDTIRTAGGDFVIKGGTSGNWKSEKTSGGGGGGGGGNTPKVTPTSSVAGVSAKTAAQQALLDRMNANSLKWHSSDPNTQSALSAENENLANQLGGFGLNITKDANGVWTAQNLEQPVPTMQQAFTQPNLTGQAMGDMYGLTYNYDDILGILNKATTASYGTQRQQAAQSENTFYKNMMDTQSTTLDTLRQAHGNAVATGASKGIAAANELSAMLNLQNTSEKESSLLANERTILDTKEQSDMALNSSTALQTSNALKQAMANIALTKYGYDVQQLIGKLDFLGAQDSATKTLEGVKYNADSNLAGTRAAAVANAASAGYSSGGSSGYSNYSGNKTASPAAITAGQSTSFEEFMKSGSGDYLDTNGLLYTKNSNGTYNVTRPGSTDQGYEGISAADLQKVQQNNDVNAWRADFKSAEFSEAANIVMNKGKPVANKSYSSAEMLAFANKDNYNWHWDKNSRGYTATPKTGTTASSDVSSIFKDGIKTGSTVAFKGMGELARDGTITYTYDAMSGMWTTAGGTKFTQSAMVDLIKKRTASANYDVIVK